MRNFVEEHCTFNVQAKDASATTVSPRAHRNRWLILLFKPFDPELDPYSIIAHEIAHAWLGHHQENTPEHEEQAEKQVKKWGFAGCGGQFHNDRWIIDDAEDGLGEEL